MRIVNTARWVASFGARIAMDIAVWTLTKVEKMGEGHLCSRLYDEIPNAEKTNLTQYQDHIHHDNKTV